jgi:hypothetical protein
MQLQNYFYFNGIPYEQLSIKKQNTIDKLIERIKRERLYERILLYQDHFFNIIQNLDPWSLKRQFESDLPADITEDIIKAYLKTTGASAALN